MKGMIALRDLVVGSAAGDHDYVSVRVGYRFEEPQWMAILRRDALHLNLVPDVEGIRSDFPDLLPCEGRRGAERESPLGCRRIGILRHDGQRAVRIYKLYFFDRS